MRILNLYAGIGGNRALWGEEHDVVAVEHDPLIAGAYQQLWPGDTMVVGDAHEFLIAHHAEFDFIWSSPPCQSHTRMQNMRVRGYGEAPRYPDGRLFEEVVFMRNWSTTPYVIENVIPYYSQWIPGAQKIERHLYWASFTIEPYSETGHENLRRVQIPELQAMHGIDLTGIRLPNKRQVLRNCVSPRVGLHILDSFLGRAQPIVDESALFELVPGLQDSGDDS
ncbi:MAG: DNA cytosine methyltransferase [Microcella pacifica]